MQLQQQALLRCSRLDGGLKKRWDGGMPRVAFGRSMHPDLHIPLASGHTPNPKKPNCELSSGAEETLLAHPEPLQIYRFFPSKF